MKNSYQNRRDFEADVAAYLGTAEIQLDYIQARPQHEGNTEKGYAYATKPDGTIATTDSRVEKAEARPAVKMVSVSLSQATLDELASFAAMPRIVAAYMTGPAKEELVRQLTPLVTKKAPPLTDEQRIAAEKKAKDAQAAADKKAAAEAKAEHN